MVNKVLIVVLVLLLLINGAIGAYAYLLSKDIDTLSEQLEGQIDSVSDQVTALSGETEDRFDTVEETIQAGQASIDALGDRVDGELAQVGDRIVGLEAGIGELGDGIGELETGVGELEAGIDELETEIDELGTEIDDIESELATIEPGLEVDEIYQAVSSAVVEVNNGEYTIGSGFIYDNDGHIVTANHVIEELTTIHIVLADGRTSPASVVGYCPLSDVAVLAVERQFDISPLMLANSSGIRIGEPAITIGSPFDEGWTVTSGIVSQVSRYEEIGDETESRWIANLLQFDAPANYGNSGGPLFNAAGEVIGLVVARVDPDMGDGISFAVSSNKMRRVADAIIEQGSFDYPWLGVNVSDITPIMAEVLGRETIHGVLVGSVTPSGPAEEAGVQADDIIIAINGVPVTEMADLVSYLGEYGSPGDTVVITIIRDGSETELTLTLGTI